MGWLVFIFLVFSIEVQLINNAVLISAVQQSDSVIHIYILFPILFHYGLLQEIEWAFWLAQLLKILSAKQEAPVQFLGQEDLLEKG